MDDRTLTQLDSKVMWQWRIQGLLRVAIFWGPLVAGAGVAVASVTNASIGAVVALTLVAVKLLITFAWPALRYEHFRYSVREHDLLVQRGVLFRRRSSIPHIRIQHVDTRQGPLERILGLSQVAVYTASGMSADGSIPGLTTPHAEAIRDELARRGGDDGV